jgi:hypothetical protein
MMKFTNLFLATVLIVGGIGGISEHAAAGTFIVSLENEASSVQNATFPAGEIPSVRHEATILRVEADSVQNAIIPVGEIASVGHAATMEQIANIPFLRPAALPEPAAWDLMLLGFCSLGFVGFAGKRRSRDSRRGSFPSLSA